MKKPEKPNTFKEIIPWYKNLGLLLFRREITTRAFITEVAEFVFILPSFILNTLESTMGSLGKEKITEQEEQ